MKTTTVLLSTITVVLTAVSGFSQDAAGGKQGGPGQGAGAGQGGPGGGQRPVPPLLAALDANHDGEIDAQELANATAALKALDKNGDGKLTGDEIHPPHGDRGPGQGEGKRGPRDGNKPQGGPRDGGKAGGPAPDGAAKKQ